MGSSGQSVQTGLPANAENNDLHVQISTKMLKLKARVLDPPRVMYSGGAPARPLDGSWNLRDKTVSFSLIASTGLES